MFPMKYLNITQGMNGSYSHQGTEKIDVAGKDSNIENIYAPYTGIIKKVYSKIGNSVWLESADPVKYADNSEDYMTIIFTHDNDVSDLWVGKTIKQGEAFYQEGRAGNATGNHVELDVGRGKFTSTGWHQISNGQWIINNEMDPTKALWLSESTIIINDGGYDWKKTDSNIYNPSNNSVIYVVKKGDTLSGIAKKYETTWLRIYNDNIKTIGSNPNLIKPGQKLVINI